MFTGSFQGVFLICLFLNGVLFKMARFDAVCPDSVYVGKDRECKLLSTLDRKTAFVYPDNTAVNKPLSVALKVAFKDEAMPS